MRRQKHRTVAGPTGPVVDTLLRLGNRVALTENDDSSRNEVLVPPGEQQVEGPRRRMDMLLPRGGRPASQERLDQHGSLVGFGAPA